MKVVVIGSGAREHALVRALIRGAKESGVEREVVAIPGNPGIAREARCVPSAGSVEALVAATVAERPYLVVVGPEAPLAAGLADRLAELGISCFGPSAAAARIEASKSFAKEIMQAAGVPTASARAFDDRAEALEHARAAGACVVKLDGLAAGKGVIVCNSSEEAVRAVDELWVLGAMQASGAARGAGFPRILIEEKIEGPELSVIGLCDGEAMLLLPPARDHKRLLDGDLGPNTGGMGAVSPPHDATKELLDEVLQTVMLPTVRELKRRGMPFHGALFGGLMLTAKGIRVLEFNCRLGDPECQALLMRVRSDLLPLFDACVRGTLSQHQLLIDPRPSVAVVLAAHGYPGTPRAGDVLSGLDLPQGESLGIFHAGTRRDGDSIVTSGGRVLSVAALGRDINDARARAYEAADQIRFDGRQMRTDIGKPLGKSEAGR